MKDRAKSNVRNVRLAMGLDVSDEENSDDENDDAGDGEEEGDENGAGPSRRAVREQQEYSDDDQLATVTIVEDADFTDISPFARTRRATSPSFSNDGAADADADAAGGAPRKSTGAAVPLMPASSGRMMAKAKKEKDRAKALKKRAKEKEDKKASKSMETSAERKRGRQMQAASRGMKAKGALDREGKTRGMTGKRGGKGGGGGGRGGKAGRGGKGRK